MPSLLQYKIKNDLYLQNGAATASFSLDSTTTLGSMLIITLTRGKTESAVASITDNNGSTFTHLATQAGNASSNFSLEVWYALGITGRSSHQITVTKTSDTLYPTAIVEEWSGLMVTSALDKTTGATGNGTSPTSGATAATTQADELVWSTGNMDYFDASFNPLVVTPGAGYSNFHQDGSYFQVTESKIVSATGAQTANYTVTGTPEGSSSPNYNVLIATFKVATLNTKSLPATIMGVAGMAKLKARFITLAASMTGVTTLAMRKSFFKTLAVTMAGIAALSKFTRHFISLSAVMHAVVNIVADKRVPDIGNKGRVSTPKLNKKPWMK